MCCQSQCKCEKTKSCNHRQKDSIGFSPFEVHTTPVEDSGIASHRGVWISIGSAHWEGLSFSLEGGVTIFCVISPKNCDPPVLKIKKFNDPLQIERPVGFLWLSPPPPASMLYIHTRKSRRTPQENILSEFSVFSLELGKIDQTITYSPRSFHSGQSTHFKGWGFEILKNCKRVGVHIFH